jgi:S-adenosylmethionine hydrolase
VLHLAVKKEDVTSKSEIGTTVHGRSFFRNAILSKSEIGTTVHGRSFFRNAILRLVKKIKR